MDHIFNVQEIASNISASAPEVCRECSLKRACLKAACVAFAQYRWGNVSADRVLPVVDVQSLLEYLGDKLERRTPCDQKIINIGGTPIVKCA